jgi:hypothetical protein
MDSHWLPLCPRPQEMDGRRILIFCETKKGCDAVTRQLRMDGWPALSIHGDKTQHERDWVLAEFKSGKHPIMIATDVAARGLGGYHLLRNAGRGACAGRGPPLRLLAAALVPGAAAVRAALRYRALSVWLEAAVLAGFFPAAYAGWPKQHALLRWLRHCSCPRRGLALLGPANRIPDGTANLPPPAAAKLQSRRPHCHLLCIAMLCVPACDWGHVGEQAGNADACHSGKHGSRNTWPVRPAGWCASKPCHAVATVRCMAAAKLRCHLCWLPPTTQQSVVAATHYTAMLQTVGGRRRGDLKAPVLATPHGSPGPCTILATLRQWLRQWLRLWLMGAGAV